MNVKNILVIEDSEAIKSLIKCIIKDLYLNCNICASLKEAENLIHDGNNFDIVILDLALQGESGMTFLKDHPELTMIITTALNDVGVKEEAQKYTNLIEYYVKPLNYSKLFKDISDMSNLDILKKLTENLNLRDAQLKESEERYAKAFMSSPYAIIITYPGNGNIIDVNEAFTEISGYTKDEIIGNSSIELNLWYNIKDREWVVAELLKGNKIISKEFKFIKKDGNTFIGLYSAQIIHIKGISHILSSIDDISEQKLAEKQLFDIIEKNPISIQVVDKNGVTLSANPAHTKLFGAIPPQNFSIFEDLNKSNPEIGNLILRARNGETVNLPDLCYNVHNINEEFPNNPVWIKAVIFPLSDANIKPDKFVIMHENITEMKFAKVGNGKPVLAGTYDVL